MKASGSSGADPSATRPVGALNIDAIISPFIIEYIDKELIPAHVRRERQPHARVDLRRRRDELIEEVLWNRAAGRPEAAWQWYLGKRRHAFTREPADLRQRRSSRLPPARMLLREYEALLADLRRLLPRRKGRRPIRDDALREMQERFPELGWATPRDSLGATPSPIAERLLALRYRVRPSYVGKSLDRARKLR